MSLLKSYRLRLERRRWRARAFRKRRELTELRNRTQQIGPGDVLLFCTLRDERIRLPYFLSYYRELGVDHFFFVDNGSSDGTAEYLAEQMDVTVFQSNEGYKRARFGVDWLNWLQMRYAHGHWSLTVVDRAIYHEGDDPLQVASWFDSGNYTIEKNAKYGNLWIQGGPRARAFFYDNAERAPAMNKIPLVKWNRAYAYVSSTHMLLPRGLNLVYDEWGGEKTSGCLLHAKFLDIFTEKSAEELERKQHFANSHEYKAYNQGLSESPDLWCQWSERYINWRQLEILGLMSKGNWA